MRRLLLLFTFFLAVSNHSSAQLLTGNAFLQGRYLEAAIAPNGSWGNTVNAPAGYHVHPGGAASYWGTANPSMDFNYDPGHDGWTAGTPTGAVCCWYGPYYMPGTPFDGWSIQVNGARSDAWYTNLGFWNATPATSTLTGSVTAYEHIIGQPNCLIGGTPQGQMVGVWTGTAGAGGALKITQTNRLDTLASCLVVTTVFKNTSAAVMTGLYYWASADPDNDEVTAGGSFPTNNHITYQNDGDHRSLVWARPPTLHQDAFSSLSTKDCRAKVLIYNTWSPYPTEAAGNTLAQVYAGTAGWLGGAYYTVGSTTDDDDIAYGLIYSLGNLAAGDSTFISYAWGFSDSTIVDSAFPEPLLYVNSIPAPPSGPAPAPTYDTFDACGYPGSACLFPSTTTLPVTIRYGSDKCWSWSSWNWSPSTGLATTTGVNDTINLSALPATITYTITGTYAPDAQTCNTRVMYLTIHTCNGAVVNSPCLGDSLEFNSPGDSASAVYAWVGPDNYTTTVATTQSFTITPSVWADTGTYHVIKTIGGITDTFSTIVTIHPKPTVTVSSNSPLCIGAANTLSLTATPGVVPVASYGWTGPAGFISALQDPTITPFANSDTGKYTVIVTTSFGCKDTGSTEVVILPPPGPPIVTGPLAYCYGTPFVPFTITPNVGATVYWYPSAAGGTGTTTVPTVNTTVPGTYVFYYGQTIGLCESPIESITIIVYPKITPDFSYDIHRGCTQDTVIFTNTSTGYTSDLWNFGDGSATSAAMPDAMHIYVTQSAPTWSVKLTDYFAICMVDTTIKVDTRHSVQAAFFAHWDTICARGSSVFHNLSTISYQGVTNPGLPPQLLNYVWQWGDGTSSTTIGNLDSIGHPFTLPGIYNVILTATDSIGCTSTANENVYVIGFSIQSWHDTTLCLKEPLPLTNVITQEPPLGLTDYTYLWTPSANLDSDDAHIPDFSNAFGSYTYELTVDLKGDWGNCYAYDTMVIHSVLGKKLKDITTSTTVNFGSSIQLNADSLLYYWWIPDNGTLTNPNINNPVATPDSTTTYTVYGMDQYGCVDSGFVTITIDSAMNEFIPTGFTPNNDGLNDYFRPVGLIFQNLVDFRVYNRWGQQVFYTNSASSKGWDGTFNGVLQDMDVYFYTIIVYRPDHGQNQIYKGDVTLIR